MPIADEFHLITDRIAFWQNYEPAVKCDLSCCAVRTARGLVFIDPISLAAPALEEFAAAASPVAVVLTNGNHARSAAQFRERFSIPILAHAEAVPALGIAVDRLIGESEILFDELTVIDLPGAAPGEIALHFSAGAMLMGDALIDLEPHGFSLLPEKYCADPAALRAGLQKLLRFEFEVLTFAHGFPLVRRARRRLATLLA